VQPLHSGGQKVELTKKPLPLHWQGLPLLGVALQRGQHLLLLRVAVALSVAPQCLLLLDLVQPQVGAGPLLHPAGGRQGSALLQLRPWQGSWLEIQVPMAVAPLPAAPLLLPACCLVLNLRRTGVRLLLGCCAAQDHGHRAGC
jgi:hypothetical protein